MPLAACRDGAWLTGVGPPGQGVRRAQTEHIPDREGREDSLGQMIPLESLTRPFSPEQVKQREGRSGKRLDYLETHAVISRLNESFEGQWSFEVRSWKVQENEVVVEGALTAEGITKTQFGGSDVTRAKETGEVVSVSDDLKAAASDALKKCATLFGVGLELYRKGDRGGTETGTKPAPQSGSSEAWVDATEAQVRYLRRLAGDPALSDAERADFSTRIEKGLSKAEASDLIGSLKDLVDSRRKSHNGRTGVAA